jgi:hypothetical protein
MQESWEKMRNSHRILLGKCETKRLPPGTHRRECDGIIGCEGAEWIQVAKGMVQWLAVVNTVMNLLLS